MSRAHNGGHTRRQFLLSTVLSTAATLTVAGAAMPAWTNVTPKDLPKYTRVSIIEPSHFTAGTMYFAANRYEMDDFAPYVYKTTDFGATWTKIINGIAPTEFARAIREDPVRKGLLFAGTERGAWVSFNDGAQWQRLQLNLPIVPVHDLTIKDGDLIVATHGRSFFVLDDISPLRQLNTTALANNSQIKITTAPDSITASGSGSSGTTTTHSFGRVLVGSTIGPIAAAVPLSASGAWDVAARSPSAWMRHATLQRKGLPLSVSKRAMPFWKGLW